MGNQDSSNSRATYAHLIVLLIAVLSVSSGCAASSTAVRRSGEMAKIAFIDTPKRAGAKFADAMERMQPAPMSLGAQHQFEQDTQAGGDTTAKVMARQLQ
ncbi:MAG: hypothetical protein AAGD11_12140 [Planctomycetota bacterium]